MELEIQRAALSLCYSANIASLIWARFFFFEIKSAESRKISYVNDPTVAAQILLTYYFILTQDTHLYASLLSGLLYLLGLVLFWWSINTAGSLSFASGDHSGKLLTTGAYALVRHPFYLSYILVWGSSTLLFNSVLLWITLIILIIVYHQSAMKEESDILNGPHSEDYLKYKARTGMFWPKIMRSKL